MYLCNINSYVYTEGRENKFISNFPINLGDRSVTTSFSIIILSIALQKPEKGK